jgi:YVTN family beta-propeller protein
MARMVVSARSSSGRWFALMAALLVGAVGAAAGPARPAHAAGPAVYVTNTGGGSVSVIDATTDTVTGTIPVGVGPTAVVANPTGTRLYVANEGVTTGSVSVIDTGTGAVVATIPVGADPRSIAITPDGRQVAVANRDDGTLSLINTGTNAVTATVFVGGNPWAVAISPDGTLAYVTDLMAQGIQVVRLRTHRWVATIPTGNWGNASVTFNPSGTTAYSGAAGGGMYYIDVIDVATNTVSRYVTLLHAAPSVTSMVVNPAGTQLWLTDDRVAAVSVLDLTTFLSPWGTVLGGQPDGIAFTHDGSKVYVANSTNDTVSVIDPATYTVTATLTGFQVPEGVTATG